MNEQPEPALKEPPPCDMCHQTGVPLMKCSGCKIAKYCSTACQTAAWVEHCAACKRARKERENLKAKEEGANAPGSGSGSGSGSGLGDMGSIMAALNKGEVISFTRPPYMPSQQKRCDGWVSARTYFS